jgi:hypothetical protein
VFVFSKSNESLWYQGERLMISLGNKYIIIFYHDSQCVCWWGIIHISYFGRMSPLDSKPSSFIFCLLMCPINDVVPQKIYVCQEGYSIYYVVWVYYNNLVSLW